MVVPHMRAQEGADGLGRGVERHRPGKAGLRGDARHAGAPVLQQPVVRHHGARPAAGEALGFQRVVQPHRRGDLDRHVVAAAEGGGDLGGVPQRQHRCDGNLLLGEHRQPEIDEQGEAWVFEDEQRGVGVFLPQHENAGFGQVAAHVCVEAGGIECQGVEPMMPDAVEDGFVEGGDRQ